MNLLIEREPFETYDPDWVFLRVVRFVEGDTYNFSDLDRLPWNVLKANRKTDTVQALTDKIGELYDLPSGRVVVLLRHEHIYNSTVRPELYNIDWRLPKTLDDASKHLDHGTVLFVEEGDPKAKLESHNWYTEFTKD